MNSMTTLLFGIVAIGMAFLLPDLVKLLLMGAFVLLPLCPAIIWGLFGKTRNKYAALWSIVLELGTTIALIPLMPQTAFGPGLVVSCLALMVGTFVARMRHPFLSSPNTL